MKIECPRCSGTGELPQFRHVENGICFLCHGAKQVEAKEVVVPERAVLCYQDNRNVTKQIDGSEFPIEGRVERFSLVVNGGQFMPNGWSYVTAITDDNREQLRELWRVLKARGCECRSFPRLESLTNC